LAQVGKLAPNKGSKEHLPAIAYEPLLGAVL